MGLLDRFFGKKEVPATDKYMSAVKRMTAPKAQQNWIKHAVNEMPSYQLASLRRNSREIAMKDPVASALFKTMESNVVGTGLKFQSTISATDLGVSETKAAKIRDAVENAFNNWADNDCDRSGLITFGEMQKIIFKTMLIDGESLAIPSWHDAAHREYGRCIQLLTADDLYTSHANQGLELDEYGAIKAYLFNTYDSHNGFKVATQNPKRINIRDPKGRLSVLHLMEVDMPGQMRGLPLLAPTMKLFTDFSDYLEAEIASARVSAALSVFVTKQDAMGIQEASMDEEGHASHELYPGAINYLSPGESISTITPKRTENFGSFATYMLRTIASSCGLPYETVTKDFSACNYSSGRLASLESRRVFNQYRKLLATKFCQPIAEHVIEEAVLREYIPVTPRQFELHKRSLMKGRWQGPAWGSIDPLKDANAAVIRINNGLTTRSDELASAGKDFSDVMNQIKREKDIQDGLGLGFSADNKEELIDEGTTNKE